MNEIIAKGLKEQLRVLRKYLVEDYPKELQDVLGQQQFLTLSNQIDNVDDYLTNYLKKEQ